MKKGSKTEAKHKKKRSSIVSMIMNFVQPKKVPPTPSLEHEEVENEDHNYAASSTMSTTSIDIQEESRKPDRVESLSLVIHEEKRQSENNSKHVDAENEDINSVSIDLDAKDRNKYIGRRVRYVGTTKKYLHKIGIISRLTAQRVVVFIDDRDVMLMAKSLALINEQPHANRLESSSHTKVEDIVDTKYNESTQSSNSPSFTCNEPKSGRSESLSLVIHEEKRQSENNSKHVDAENEDINSVSIDLDAKDRNKYIGRRVRYVGTTKKYLHKIGIISRLTAQRVVVFIDDRDVMLMAKSLALINEQPHANRLESSSHTKVEDAENTQSSNRSVQSSNPTSKTDHAPKQDRAETFLLGDKYQMKAIELAKQGENIFLTGKAGTGKSWTIEQIFQQYKNVEKILHITAPTGIAAINVNGVTIHFWGGFGKGETHVDFNKMMAPDVRTKIQKAHALLIDEISMLDGHSFDVLEFMVSYIRCYKRFKDRFQLSQEEVLESFVSKETNQSPIVNDNLLEMRWKKASDGGLVDVIKPWGGMQVIVVGDFFQLPPIPSYKKGDEDEVFLPGHNAFSKKVGRQGCYAFQSYSWQNSKLHCIELQNL